MAYAGKPNHLEQVYFKGDRCEYTTGKPVDKYGAIFFEVKMLEGINKGKLFYIRRTPVNSATGDPFNGHPEE